MSLSALAQALRDPAAPPAGLKTWNGSDPVQRFNVYRNNVAVSLASALETTFPVVRQLVGDAFFAGLAQAYISVAPPRSPLMARYGGSLPFFIESFEPARRLPYLADVARLEALRIEAFHAADAGVIVPQAFADIAAEALPATRVKLHPAARLLRSRHPVVAIWSAHQGTGDFAQIDLDVAEDALITRPELDVTVMRLAPGVAAALEALGGNATMAEAAGAGMAADAAFNPTELFATLITSGAVESLMPGDDA